MNVQVKTTQFNIHCTNIFQNFKLLQESIICQTCLEEIQSACKFKKSYSKNACKILDLTTEVENDSICEICKNLVNPVDSIRLFDSVTEIDKLNLIKYLSAELVSISRCK